MRRGYKAGFTIETACLLPVIALTFVLCVWGSFYYHDKNILSSCAYETAVVGGRMAREKELVTEEMLNAQLTDKIKRKCILFSDFASSVEIKEEAVVVTVTAQRRSMKTVVKHTSAITEPEEYIRNIRKLG